MMRRLFFLLAIWMALPMMGVGQTAHDRGTLTIRITGFRNQKGQVCVSLFNQPKGFPGKYIQAFKIVRAPVTGKQVAVEFPDIPFGYYAASVLHDENMNNKLETSFLGIPKEGVGASNNPRSILGPPSFEDSKFTFNASNTSTEIRLKYW